METSTLKKQQVNRLIFLGVVLFFLGLIVGLLVPILLNPRLGLSSHIEGVMNGIFLVILGLIWNKIEISDKWLKITFWLAIYGTFANWFAMLIAAIFNAGKMFPIASDGIEGPAFAEILVMFFLITLTIAMLVICVSVLVGLWKGNKVLK